jgi:dihydrofolate reductase
MGKFKIQITMTLDGYVAGRNQSVKNPLGEGADRIHDWARATKFLRELLGSGEGGDTGIDDQVLRESFANVGATIMGRNMFGGGPGPWGDGSWKGWWGDNPPFQTPVFVLTHYAREPLVMEGGTTFYFVTDGIESALKQARRAADDKDVALGGGANVAQQYLNAGLIDQLTLHLVPMFLGGGERLFDGIDAKKVSLEVVDLVHSPVVSHLRYEVKK